MDKTREKDWRAHQGTYLEQEINTSRGLFSRAELMRVPEWSTKISNIWYCRFKTANENVHPSGKISLDADRQQAYPMWYS